MDIEERADLTFKILQKMQGDTASSKDELREINQRLSSIEVSTALIHTDMAAMNARLDRMSNRIERLERRMDLA